jgi:catechol 2,3-dioxygenase-like lactoylglutathione lyase family enzyme
MVISLKTKIVTSRLAETRDWYLDLLGLSIVEEWDAPGDRGCILGLSRSSGEALLEIHEGEPASGYGGLSLQFRVDAVDAFAVQDDPRFSFKGPIDRPWGSRYLYFSDPNGISVILFAGSSF